MSQPPTRKYPAEFKERAVKLAVESEQPIAPTARDLGVNENTLHTWIGKYPGSWAAHCRSALHMGRIALCSAPHRMPHTPKVA